MDRAPRMSGELAVEVTSAPQIPRQERSQHTWIWISVAIVAVVVAGSLFALQSFNILDRILGRAEQDSSLYVVIPVDLSITLTEDGELKPKNSIEIKCELEGQNTILTVAEESTQVKKGDLLIELASDAIKDRLDTEKIQLDSIKSALIAAQQDLEIIKSENQSKKKICEIDSTVAELELERYKKGDYQRSLKSAEINIAQSIMDIEQKKEDLTKNEELEKKGFVTTTKIKQLRFELQKAEWQLEQNELQKSILEQYEKKKNETQKESALEQAIQELDREKQRAASREAQAIAKVKEQQSLLETRQKRYDRLEEQYAKCKIHAPVDGIVQYPSDDSGWRFGGNRIAAGEKAYEGQTLIVLPDTTQMIVTTRIHEADRHKVHEDLPCLVKVPAVPDHTFPGKISRIAQFADTANRWLNPELKEHSAEILLDETAAPLSPGDSAEIKILIEELKNVLAVPVQCIFSRGSKNYVFKNNGGTEEYIEVKLGRSSESMVEIVEGVRAGDEILRQVDERLVATLPAPSTTETELSKLPPPSKQQHAQPAGKRQRPPKSPKSAGITPKTKSKGG